MLDEFLMLVEEIGDGLELGIELDALPLKFQVGETELSLIGTGQGSTSGNGERSSRCLAFSCLQYIGCRHTVKSLQ